MRRANPPLVIFGNPDGAHSETHAWTEVRRLVTDVMKSVRLAERDQHKLDMVLTIADDMKAQVTRGVHRNPEGQLSETSALNKLYLLINDLYVAASGGDRESAELYRQRAETLVDAMKKQVARGVHKNPVDIGKRTKIGQHVQAVAYVHAKNGGQYVHGFGDAKLNENDLKRGILRLSDLKDRTDVEMYGNADGTVTLVGTHGQPLAALFS